MSAIVLSVVVLLSLCEGYAAWDPPIGDMNTTTVHFYRLDKERYCPAVDIYVRAVVEKWYFRDPSYTAAFLRLFYSDCFVKGCDASILLDGRSSEKTAPQNFGLRGFEVIDDIKKVLEHKCPGKVSCADILALATRDFVALAGGPAFPTVTGRKDGYLSLAKNVILPGPDASFAKALALFESKGLAVEDLVTLLGAHTMGKAHCRFASKRLYDTKKSYLKMNSSLEASLKKTCPKYTGNTYNQEEASVYMTPSPDSESYVYDNTYYKRILTHEALFPVDQALLYNKTTKALVKANADDFEAYKFAVADSMGRMGTIEVLTGNQGEIRKSCRVVNKYYH